jgi:hypothetical protein
MRFLKKGSARTPESEALETRLDNIAARARLAAADEIVPEEPAARAVERRFWTPDDIPEGDRD